MRVEVNDEKIEQYRKCDLFLLDDFGRVYSTDFPLSKFEDIIEYRYSEMKSTCITTNLSKDQLRRMRIYARIIDRWADPKLFRFIEIAGKSKRTL